MLLATILKSRSTNCLFLASLCGKLKGSKRWIGLILGLVDFEGGFKLKVGRCMAASGS